MTQNSIIPISAFRDNYIWTWFDHPTKTAWVVDPGDATPVIQTLNQKGFDLAGILLTHHHHDHSGGVGELIRLWPNVTVFGSYKSMVKEINFPVKEGIEIQCSPFQFKVLEIPGHTLDHIAFYNDKMLFCGDTLFSAGCGRVFEGTPEMMYQSLEKLANLPKNTQVYCGHEYTQANLKFAHHVEPKNPYIASKIEQVNDLRAKQFPTLPSTLSEERQMNPFLRCLESDVIQAAELHAHKKLTNPVDVFAELRNWKNSF